MAFEPVWSENRYRFGLMPLRMKDYCSFRIQNSPFPWETINKVFTFQQDCNSANKIGWTNNNALSCSDSKACTRNDRCSNGGCVGTPFTCLSCEECYNDACRVKTGWCVIQDGNVKKCFRHGSLRPGYQCQVRCDE